MAITADLLLKGIGDLKRTTSRRERNERGVGMRKMLEICVACQHLPAGYHDGNLDPQFDLELRWEQLCRGQDELLAMELAKLAKESRQELIKERAQLQLGSKKILEEEQSRLDKERAALVTERAQLQSESKKILEEGHAVLASERDALIVERVQLQSESKKILEEGHAALASERAQFLSESGQTAFAQARAKLEADRIAFDGAKAHFLSEIGKKEIDEERELLKEKKKKLRQYDASLKKRESAITEQEKVFTQLSDDDPG